MNLIPLSIFLQEIPEDPPFSGDEGSETPDTDGYDSNDSSIYPFENEPPPNIIPSTWN